MCPLERAKIDSVWASTDRSNLVSRTTHGSVGKKRCWIIGPQQFGEIGHHDARAMLAQRLCLPDAVYADDAGEAPSPPGFHAGERVLEDRGLSGRHFERPRAGQEGIRRWLPLQPLALGHHPVDAGFEESLYSGGDQHVAGVGARRDYGAAQASVARRLEVAHRAVVDLYASFADQP